VPDNPTPHDLEERKKEVQALKRQLQNKLNDIEKQMSSSTLLEKEIELERLERHQQSQASLYSTLPADTDDHKPRHQPSLQRPRGLKVNQRNFRNRILILIGVLFFIVYLIFHAVK